MRDQTVFTLPEIARLVDQPQHRLIHLCEKGAVLPDIEDARGRGASRRFSRRNILEFAVALELRRMMLPVAAAAAVIRVLREFERHVAREIRSFNLPDGLRAPDAPDLRVILSDGRLLYFTLGRVKSATRLFGGVDIESAMAGEDGGGRRVIRETAAASVRTHRGRFGMPEGSKRTRLEVSITQIAQDLPLP